MNNFTIFPKYYLGKLCIHQHEYESTGKSLRRKSNYECTKCSSEREKARKPRYPVAEPYLGKLCIRKHEHKNTGKTLRDTNGRCAECDRAFGQTKKGRESKDKWRKRNPELAAAYTSEWQIRNQEKVKQAHLKYKSKLDYKERMAVNRKIRYQRNLEKERLKGIIQNKRRKAQKLANHSHPYTAADVQKRFQDFEGNCAYCGEIATSIDHWISLKAGGPDVLGNLLPACMRCNPAKGIKEGEAWFRSQPFFKETRWQKIKAVLGIGKNSFGTQLPLF